MRSALAGVLALLTLAQDPQQPIPRFRSGVDVVSLDVTVLDGNRRPVRGRWSTDGPHRFAGNRSRYPDSS